MPTSRFFWKVFLAYAGLIVLTVVVGAAAVARWQEIQLAEQVQRRLEDSAILVRANFGDSFAALPADSSQQQDPRSPTQRQQQLRKLGQETNTRYTLVDAVGKVLADSNQPTLADVAAMENHRNREEFVEAAAAGAGRGRRVSPTLGNPFLYYAISVEHEGKLVGFVRAAESVASVRAEVDALRRLIGLVGSGIGLSGLAVAYWLTMRITNPIRKLTETVDEIAAGNYPGRIDVPTGDEIGTLARSFEKMCRNLDSREQQLRESVELQRTVLGGMVEGVLALDDRQRVIFANAAAGAIFSFDPEQVRGAALLKVVRSNPLWEIVQQTLDSGKCCRGEVDWKAGRRLTLDVHAAPLSDDGRPGLVLVLHDISELKRLEGMRQQFVANVSHELKTPLSSIKAYTETLIGGTVEDGEKRDRFLRQIDKQADRLHKLIIDMLALARIESGQSTTEIVRVPIARVVERCLADHLTQAESQQIKLKDEINDSALAVKADEESLRQILDNLVDNAIKYTPAEGAVTVRSHRDGARVVIEVVDAGIGIAAEHHKRLFERFYRVDKARSQELGGTGLGLSIVKHLCQAMGGTVAVQSEMGKGSVFRVNLPAADASTDA